MGKLQRMLTLNQKAKHPQVSLEVTIFLNCVKEENEVEEKAAEEGGQKRKRNSIVNTNSIYIWPYIAINFNLNVQRCSKIRRNMR